MNLRPLNALLAVTLALAAAAPARAAVDPRRIELTPLVGAWIPLGQSRQDFRAAPLAGVQLAYDVDPHFAIVGTFSWAGTSAKQLSGADLDLYQYDLGLRGQHAFALGRAATLRPFLGVGVGQCRFQFRDDEYADGPGFAFYSSAGLEVGYRALAASLTGRHQIHSVDADALGTSPARQNLELFTSVGLRF
jgi:hypothetical protein